MPTGNADLVAADRLSFAQLLTPQQLSEVAATIAAAREQGCTLGEEKGRDEVRSYAAGLANDEGTQLRRTMEEARVHAYDGMPAATAAAAIEASGHNAAVRVLNAVAGWRP